MTRINCVDPCLLLDQHLIAEYRELPRIFAHARALKPKEEVERYRLGSGHVRFFYPRTGFLAQRQRELISECLRRGFQISHHTAPDPIEGLDDDWTPTVEDQRVNLERLCAKLDERPAWYRLRGDLAPPDHYRNIMELLAVKAAQASKAASGVDDL